MHEERKRLVYEVSRRRARGESIRGITRALGIARKTVRNILRELDERREQGDDALGQAPGSRRAPRPSKLDDYVDQVADLLRRFPDVRATRLHEELVALGFDGGYTIVRNYLNKVRPKPAPRAAKLVETAAGEQGQVDWSPYELADGTPIHALSCVLSYSRFQYLRFCEDMSQPTLFRQLRRAFEHCGGVARQYVFDSMKTVVDRWELNEPVLNLRAIDFAAYYGFSYHIAPRRDPKYKGKVERPFRYVDESFFNARSFRTCKEANETMEWWLERANARVHGRTRRRPVDALAEEIEHLRPLPCRPFDDRELGYRIVDGYGYVAFGGNNYLARGAVVGSWICVRAGEVSVDLYDLRARLVASHTRAQRNAGLYVPPARKGTAHRRRSVTELLLRFETWGQTATAFARKVAQNKRYASLELTRLLDLQIRWAAQDLLASIEHAHRYGAFDTNSVERILKTKFKPRPLRDQMAERAKKQIQLSMAETPVRQRSVADYARLLASPALSNADAQTENEDGPNPPEGAPDADP